MKATKEVWEKGINDENKSEDHRNLANQEILNCSFGIWILEDILIQFPANPDGNPPSGLAIIKDTDN